MHLFNSCQETEVLRKSMVEVKLNIQDLFEKKITMICKASNNPVWKHHFTQQYLVFVCSIYLKKDS